MHFSTLFATLLLGACVSAHFQMNYPKSFGFDEDTETELPCGGEDISFDDTTDAPVDGFPVALSTEHPQAQFLYRGTLDQKAPFNWTNLLPVVNEMGIGDFCIPNMKAPAMWANQTGLVQIIMDGPDGILYQVRHRSDAEFCSMLTVFLSARQSSTSPGPAPRSTRILARTVRFPQP